MADQSRPWMMVAYLEQRSGIFPSLANGFFDSASGPKSNQVLFKESRLGFSRNPKRILSH
jgi:hypothetical protein